jgi:hypothetical protein
MKKRCMNCEHRNSDFSRHLMNIPNCRKGKKNKNGDCKTYKRKMCWMCGFRPVQNTESSFCKPCDELAGMIC